MDYTGLIHKDYRFNRELTEEERERQLRQKERLDIETHYGLSVVKMSGTYLELVDRYYEWRGVLFTFMSALIAVFGIAYLSIIAIAIGRADDPAHANDWLGVLIVSVLWLPIMGLMMWVALKESFTHTYFPIRLNRRNRKVYVFRPGRPGKPILTADWDKLFFTLGRCRRGMEPGQNWDVRGHVLADDGKTVLDTFALSPSYMPESEDGIQALKGHWEFVRRYMEENPKETSQRVEMCVPIDGTRESLAFGRQRFHGNFYPSGLWAWYLLYPLWQLCILGRWIAGLTCRPPVWPAEIEAQCRIEPGDPYARDASMNPPDVAR